MKIQNKILQSLLNDEDYCRKVASLVKKDYFKDVTECIIADEILKFYSEYNKHPSRDILLINITNRRDLRDEKQVDDITDYILALGDDKEDNVKWLLEETEKYCKRMAANNAVFEAVELINKDKEKNTITNMDKIPLILQEALSVSLDKSIGHDYIESSESRYDFYHTKEDKIPFDLDNLNKITKGGLSRKTLTTILAGTGQGKSLFMCHHAATCLSMGKNVLYITLEMAEERIAERIDANLMNLTSDELFWTKKRDFLDNIDSIKRKTNGTLIIKEYSTSSAHTGHFRNLLEELKIKRSFTPDIIFVDYVNICVSQRFSGQNVNSYTYIKHIAEELRGLAGDYNVPVVTATQTNRGGYGSADPEITDIAESFGLPATSDLMFVLFATEAMAENNQLYIKQLKNRYNDINYKRKFIIGIDKSKYKLFDVEDEVAESSLYMDDTSIDENPSSEKSSGNFVINKKRKGNFNNFT